MWDRIPHFSLGFVRVGSFLLAMPLVGGRIIPAGVRVWLAVALCWAVIPIVPVPGGGLPLDLLGWGVAAVREAIIGLGLGWLAQVPFAAVPLAGQMLGLQMGVSMANVMDPVGQQQLSVIAEFLNVIAFWFFLAVDGHHLVISGLLESFRWFPLAGAGPGPETGVLGIEMGRQMFRSALLLAAPGLLVLMAMQVGLGIVARVVPQMNVFIVAVPLQIAIGLLAMAAGLALLGPWMGKGLGWLMDMYSAMGTGA
jgi:flagellar biosynthesis protein FliR